MLAHVRIFLAGATGVIGARLLPLLAVGHEVTAMTRSQAKVDNLRAAGATPVVCDVFDVEDLRATVAAAAPEVVIHELTDLPKNLDPRKAEEQLAGNDRIREEGTRNLVDAAVAAGARRFVAQSIAFVYEPTGEPVKSEEDPLYHDAPWPFSRTIAAVESLEKAVTQTAGIDGLVLRYGFFYGPGSGYAADGSVAAQVRKRRFSVVGAGEGVFSFIHVDDAAAATLAAVERGAPAIYNIVDDDPAPLREWLPAYAEALGAKKPRRVPKLIARLVAGRYATMLATELRGASNEKAKRQLGWAPRYPSWREGLPQSIRAAG
jgi:2-alkyl-3-oxoalkanoate reductase